MFTFGDLGLGLGLKKFGLVYITGRSAHKVTD